MARIIPVILCGGSGTRLWPLSRTQMPKQFLKLMDDHTLLQKTAQRVMDIMDIDGGDIVTITLKSLKDETAAQLRQISPALIRHILLEPQARNTAAAVALAIHYVRRIFGDDCLLWILPADHFIGDEPALKAALLDARAAALDHHLVTFGIRPTRPETGYGYIHRGEKLDDTGSYKVGAFIEKPERAIATQFVNSGTYLWSSGMHLFHVLSGQDHYLRLASHTWGAVGNAMNEAKDLRQPASIPYDMVREEPFEMAILEKSDAVAVMPCDPQWSDIGSWESLWEIREKDEFGNALNGDVLCHDTKNSMVLAQDRLVTCVGLEDIIVIETGDSVLVAKKDCNGSLKTLVNLLRKMNKPETVLYKKPATLPDNIKDIPLPIAAQNAAIKTAQGAWV